MGSQFSFSTQINKASVISCTRELCLKEFKNMDLWGKEERRSRRSVGKTFEKFGKK